MPAGSKALASLVREASIGVGLGVVAGFMWKFSITAPHKATVTAYYDNLNKNKSKS